MQDAETLAPAERFTDCDAGSHATIVAAGIVHDLGNLIQIASSALSILARTPEAPPEHNRPILHRARAALDHAGGIVRQNLAGLCDGAAPTARSNVAAALLDVAALAETMGDASFGVALDLAPNLPDVRCNSIGLRRSLLNLILNARDAMAGSGTAHVAAHNSTDSVELRVSDHGIGMTAAVAARVFDPTFTTKRDGLGGIGLPMVKRFVGSVGGEMAIDSTPGIGTTVTLRLPTAAPLPIIIEL